MIFLLRLCVLHLPLVDVGLTVDNFGNLLLFLPILTLSLSRGLVTISRLSIDQSARLHLLLLLHLLCLLLLFGLDGLDGLLNLLIMLDSCRSRLDCSTILIMLLHLYPFVVGDDLAALTAIIRPIKLPLLELGRRWKGIDRGHVGR